jgi:hypothetical protein
MRAWEVRAILEGRKTQTRRVVKPDWWRCLDPEDEHDRTQALGMCPYGQPGDRLYVMETWAMIPEYHSAYSYLIYRATYPGWDDNDSGLRWRPSVHMPRLASRIDLEIAVVRVERLNEISEEDAIAEGVQRDTDGWFDYQYPGTQCCTSARGSFQTLWESINGPGSFDDRFVWVVEFKPITGTRSPAPEVG